MPSPAGRGSARLPGRFGLRERPVRAMGLVGRAVRAVVGHPATVGPLGAGVVGWLVGCGVRARLAQRVVERLLVDPRLVEGIATAAVREREPRGHPHVLLGDRGGTAPGGVRACGAGHHQVGPHAVDVEGGADRRDPAQLPVVEPDRGQPQPGVGDATGGAGLRVRPRRREPGRVVLERQPPAHDLDPGADLARRAHVDREPEPVEQLRAQLPLLGVHRADQQEPRRVRDGDPVALDVRPAHRRGVEQQVDEVVVQEVDLVDVEHAAVRVGEQPRLVGPHPLRERPLQVERPDQPVLRGSHGQLDEPRGAGLGPAAARVRAVGAPRVGVGRVAAEAAAGDDGERREQGGERPDGGGLGGALLAAHEHPADGRVHRVEQQREQQVVVPDHRREREPGIRQAGGHGCGAHEAEPARPDATNGRSAAAP